VLPMWRAGSSCAATAPTVEASAVLRARTAPNRRTTRARAGPPTAPTTWAWIRPAPQRATAAKLAPVRRVTSLTPPKSMPQGR
jgi:hypothetical protein